MFQNPILIHHNSIKMLQDGKMPNPYFVDLQLSNKCNQNCKGCAYREYLPHDGKMMSEEDATKIVNDLMDLGVKGFDFCGGGEPTTLSYLPELWNTIKGRGGYYSLITNGTLLPNRIVKQLAEQATYVRFSFEASNLKDYCRYKGVGKLHWDLLIHNTRKMINAKNEIHSDCEVGIKFAIGKSLKGLRHYYGALALYKDLCPDNIQFKALRHKPEELSLGEKINENVTLWSAFRREDSDLVRSWIIPKDNKNVPQCWLNPLHTVVDEKGNVYICCYFYYRSEEHLLGNMLKQPIKDIWYSEQHIEKVKKISRKKCEEVDCKFFRHHKDVEGALKNGRHFFM